MRSTLSLFVGAVLASTSYAQTPAPQEPAPQPAASSAPAPAAEQPPAAAAIPAPADAQVAPLAAPAAAIQPELSSARTSEPVGAPVTPDVPAAVPEPVAAQAPTKVKAADIEEIVVTGSRINRADLNTAAPVTVVDRASIVQSGRASIGDVIQNIPSQTNGQNSQVNNGGDGSSNVDLRGLEPKRTLVLVNGRRFVGGGAGSDGVVDLNTIPFSAVERIEILKDGASAVYGSDAIGGVVNIITRKNYNGTEASVYGGVSGHGDGQIVDVNVTSGGKSDKFSYLFSAGYYRQWSIFADKRGFSAEPQKYDYRTGEVSTTGSPVGPEPIIFDDDDIVGGNAAWQALVDKYAGDPDSGQYIHDPDGTWRLANLDVLKSQGGDQYNFQPYNYITIPSQRFSTFATTNYQLTENTKFFTELSYTNRRSTTAGAPTPLFTAGAVRISANSIYNPFGRDFEDVVMRLMDFGPRIQEFDLNTFRLVGGFNGHLSSAFGPLEGWGWEAYLNYGRTMGIQTKTGGLQVSKIQNAVGPSFYDADGVARCGTPGKVIDGCVPLNLFGGKITQDQIDYLTFTGVQRVLTEQAMVGINATGDLFKLAANRPASLAIGYELRHERGAYTPDPLTASGDSSGNQIGAVAGAYTVNEGYLELLLPILSGVTGVHDLELSGAARVFNYNTFGSNFTYKVGARYRPFRELTLRGTYSTAFRAPNIDELYSGQSDSYLSVATGDPCSTKMNASPSQTTIDRCNAAGGQNADTKTQFKAKVGGNPGLKPETAKTLTAGFVFEPRIVRGFTLTADWYSIDISNAIQSIGSDVILDLCYRKGNTQYCDLVERDSASHKITKITDTNQNAGGQRTAGLDIGARYDYRSPIGTFVAAVDLNWLQKMDYLLAGGAIVNAKGNYDEQIVFPAIKAMARLVWGLKGMSAGINGRLVGAYSSCLSNVCNVEEDLSTAPYRNVPAYTAWDLFLGYSLRSSGGTTNATFGINNLFDQDPPLLYNNASSNNTDPVGGYDLAGRYFYLKLSHAI